MIAATLILLDLKLSLIMGTSLIFLYVKQSSIKAPPVSSLNPSSNFYGIFLYILDRFISSAHVAIFLSSVLLTISSVI